MSDRGRELKTRCLILKKIPYRETSLIVEAISREHGKITIMAKGVRKEKSSWLGLFDILNELDLILYNNPSSQWYTFKSGLLLDSHLLDKNINCSSLMQAAAELYKQIETSQPEYGIMYHLLVTYLKYVPTVQVNAIAIFWRFLMRLFTIYGIDLDFNQCIVCGCTNDFSGFYPQKNGFICDNCLIPEISDYVIPLNNNVGNIIKLLPEIGNYINQIKLDKNTINSINRVFLLHLSEHFHHHIKLLSLDLYSIPHN